MTVITDIKGDIDLLDLQITDVEFIVCDVETTGLSPERNRLTEIALRRVVNGSIIDRFESLINPHQFVSYEIQRMTGISNEMVYNAPEPEDVLTESLKFIGNGIFVAHNARFDYSFLNSSLARSGINSLENQVLCTSRLARRLAPNRKRTGLGNLAHGFGIQISNRHRAGGDAEATAQILIRFLEILQEEFNFTEVGEVVSFQYKPVYRITKPPNNVIPLQPILAAIPHSSGVYYYHDRFGNIIYIGKAKDLHNRVNSYFHHNLGHTEKVRKLVRTVRSITWETTETELSALLLESRSIKQHQPEFNTLLKRNRKYPFIKVAMQEEYPRVDWTYDIEDDGAEYFGPFASRFAVEDALASINKLFLLRECDESIKADPGRSPCMYYDIKRCNAPCAVIVSREEYLEEVLSLTLFLQGKQDELLATFTDRMNRKAEELRFEEAAVLRDRLDGLQRILRQQRMMARSVRRQDLVIITLARKTFVELHLIKSGMLATQMLVDQKQVQRKEIRSALERVFYSKQQIIFGSGQEDINEMRIIASWCLTRRDDSTVLEADEYENIDTLLDATLNTIENAGKSPQSADSEPKSASG